jgi:hypothetical protein
MRASCDHDVKDCRFFGAGKIKPFFSSQEETMGCRNTSSHSLIVATFYTGQTINQDVY